MLYNEKTDSRGIDCQLKKWSIDFFREKKMGKKEDK